MTHSSTNKTTLENKLPTLIGMGIESFVYKISDDHVAKVRRELTCPYLDDLDFEYCVCRLREEYEIAKELYDEGISVPKPEGIYKFKPEWAPNTQIMTHWRTLREKGTLPNKYNPKTGVRTSAIVPAYFMEYVNGQTVEQLHKKDPKTANKAIASAHAEIKKAESLGFLPCDELHLWNIIWSEERNKAVLIDFSSWQ